MLCTLSSDEGPLGGPEDIDHATARFTSLGREGFQYLFASTAPEGFQDFRLVSRLHLRHRGMDYQAGAIEVRCIMHARGRCGPASPASGAVPIRLLKLLTTLRRQFLLASLSVVMRSQASSGAIAERNEEINRRRMAAGRGGPLRVTDPAALARLMAEMRDKAEQQR